MSVKLALLKSGEDIVADIKEARDKETKEAIWYVFKNPVRVELVPVKVKEILNEEQQQEGEDNQRELFFSPWIPLSADNEIIVPMDWVVTVVEPHEQVMKSYTERVGVDTEAPAVDPEVV
tara:strand:+ start:189 stop:548 length:360 start_codon:yes stop_codon:yes gene_type:complete